MKKQITTKQLFITRHKTYSVVDAGFSASCFQTDTFVNRVHVYFGDKKKKKKILKTNTNVSPLTSNFLYVNLINWQIKPMSC